MAEVHVESLAGNQGSGAGVAVLAVNARRCGAILAKHFLLPKNFSAGAVQAKRFQRLIVALAFRYRHGGRQIDFAFTDNWRRPAAPWDVLLPDHVPLAVPGSGQTAAFDMPLAGGTAELRPILGPDRGNSFQADGD